MKIEVSEATGAVLDWMVAKAEGHMVARHNTGQIYLIDTPWADKRRIKWIAQWTPSTAWAQGGPIIERERINLEPFTSINGDQWSADSVWDSPTPLIAAMRCYVASKLGDEVEVPEELL